MDYLHLYNHRLRIMSTPKKVCQKCGSSYRGTRDPEEILCARCIVLHCQVPENIDEQFLTLLNEYHGSKFASGLTLQTDEVIVVVEDILDHRKRLQKLENDFKNRKQDKGRMRMMREIKRLKDEKDVMEDRVKKIKSKLMLFILTMPTRHQKAISNENKLPSEPKKVSSPSSVSGPIQGIVSPSASPNNTTAEKGNVNLSIPSITTTDSPKPPNRRSSPRKNSPPQKQQETLSVKEESPSTPKSSPVKQAAAKFEEAAKRVKSVVTFASPNTSIRKGRIAPTPQKVEVNNNTPVTASSSSDEEEIESASQLKRSNSVRDRIKRFEELQRRASTGSYDRKKSKASAGGMIKTKHKSMVPLNN